MKIVTNYRTISTMNRSAERGSYTIMLISLILLTVFLISSLTFGFWAFASRQDYKNNVDQKITAAVKVAVDKNSTEKDNLFAEQEKQPLKVYAGPDTYGSVTIKYPKTWGAYVVEGGSGSRVLDGYFQPNFVPSAQLTTAFALRLQVIDGAYDRQLAQFDSLVKTGKVKVTAYRAPLVPSILGSRIDGAIASNKQGSIVLFPLRDKTLLVSTEASQFEPDFNNNILPNLRFSP